MDDDKVKRLRIAKAEPEHLPRVVDLMRGLAEFEKLLDEFFVTPELLEQHIFGDKAAAELLVGYVGNEVRGYALYYHNFPSLRGRPGMYLEDVYVETCARGRGLGKALMVEVARIARERGCPRFEWVERDWNERAIKFYESLGAKPLNDWTLYRMDETALSAFLDAEQRQQG